MDLLDRWALRNTGGSDGDICVYRVLVDRVLDAEAEHEETRLLGIYTSRRRAYAALARLSANRSYRRLWRYSVEQAVLDRTWWEEGFFTFRWRE